jgi:hypothetical protein
LSRLRRSAQNVSVLLIAVAAVATPASSARNAATTSPEFGFSPGAGPGTVTQFERHVLDRYFASARSVGATLVRLDAWRTDRALAFRVARAQAAGLHVELSIKLTGAVAPGAYGRTCRQVAKIYRPRGVRSFEMGNEPNRASVYRARPNPKLWGKQQRSCARAIRAVASDAHIVSGGLAPYGRYGEAAADGTAMNPLTFLKRAYASGLRTAPIDAVGWHPYNFRSAATAVEMISTGIPSSAWAQMAWTTPNVRSLMIANGDGKLRIDATEWGAPTNAGDYTEGVSEEEQANLMTLGIAAWKTYPWHGDLLVYSWLDRGSSTTVREDHFGLLRPDFTPKPAAAAFQAVVAG